MAGKHIPALMLISSVLLVISSFPTHHQSNLLVISSLPARQTELEALSWDVNTQEYYSEYTPSLSLRLHHVDNILMSPPLNSTPKSLFKNRLSRDALRANSISAMSSPVTSGYPMGIGEYFTRIGVGTPARDAYMILDTASDIVWLQCAPCVKCYKQTYPIFKPKNSKSFSGVQCKSKLCDLLEYNGKCGKRKQCIYEVGYGDGSVSVGDFSTETLTFGNTKVPKVALGCGRYNKGLFFAASGLLGLGRGKLSFPGQIGNKFGNKFSYCLGNASQLIFGDSSVYKKVIFTPLVTNPIPRFNTFYYVVLEGISVGGLRVQGIKASTFDFDRKSGLGGVMFDSGTTVTRLAPPAYLALRDAFRDETWKLKLKRASKFLFLDTCYDLSGTTEVQVPTVVLHFYGNADMSLPASNYMIPVDDNGKFCFAFAAMDGGLSIIGNIQQQGFGMVFDLADKRVGFAPNAC